VAAAGVAGGCSLIHGVSAAGSGRRRDEPAHAVVVRVPVVAGDGNKVPLVVEMAHPMEPEHYIRSVEVTSARDPVPSKGMFHLTPGNGQVYLAFQARLDEGVAEIGVTAECSVHGRSASPPSSVTIPDGRGGCAGPLAGDTPRSLDVRPPRIRIPASLKGRGIRAGEVFAVQVGLAHPNRTGLARREGRFVAAAEPFHLERIEIFYGEESISRFLATAGWSDDPLLTFRLRVRRDDVLRVVATNSRRQRLAAEQAIRLTPSA
jgi:sulfur-oxidizing protein SoxY